MKVTTRGKWLTAVAAAVAAWVFFGPRDSDSVEATEGGAQPARHAAHAVASATPRINSGALQSLARRVADPAAAGALFATHSWYVAPPPPPPVVTAPVAPPKPEAPPLPYQFLGSYTPDGQKQVFFLSNGDKVYDVHLGDTLENVYSVDRFSNGQLVLTYKPLNVQQQLSLTGVVK